MPEKETRPTAQRVTGARGIRTVSNISPCGEKYVCECPGVSREILERAIFNRPPNEDRIRGVL